MSIAERVGPLRIISHIAEGGMGRVYLARHEEKNRNVAIKVLPEKFLTDRKRSQYLEREVKIAQKLRHPNVVDIYGLYRENGVGYLVMEYLDGGNLRRHIKTRDLSFSDTLDIILKICEGLHYIHHHKFEDGRFHSIIHMDIKPENILLSQNGRIKVADFGLSLSEDFWRLRKSRTRAGTPFYMSPEQIRGKSLDIRTDIYSLGLVIYELLTGQLPFKGQDREMYMKMVVSRKVTPAPPSYIDKTIPPQFDKITMKALAKKTEDRYQTVAEMMLDLQRLSPMLTPDDLCEEFRFMRSINLNNISGVTKGAAENESHGEPAPYSTREEDLPAKVCDADDGRPMKAEPAESVVDFDEAEQISRGPLQEDYESLYGEEQLEKDDVRSEETAQSNEVGEDFKDTDLESVVEGEVEQTAVAEAGELPEKEQDEPVGEFMPAVDNEIDFQNSEDAETAPAALGENSGLVDAELVLETEQGGNGEAGNLQLDTDQADTESEEDGFSTLDVEEIASFIFIGREKG